MRRSSSLTTGSNWNMSPTSRSCLPPNGCRMLRENTRNTLSMKSMISARTMLISSITISSTSRRILRFSDVYFIVARRLRTEYRSSSGSSGWKGSLKKLCKVVPPAFMAAMPVGARMTCFFLVFAHIWRRNVDLPVPAFPVRKSERLVYCIICRACCNSLLSVSSIGINFCIVS